MKLDRIDIKILHELQKNGRDHQRGTGRVGQSFSEPMSDAREETAVERLHRWLFRTNQHDKLGQTMTVFTEITLRNHRQIDFARFLTTIEKIDQVMECHLVSGGYDYLLKFVTAGIVEYQEIMERLSDMEIGIDRYFSFVV